METSDDLLFSKESPLLPAAAELAFHTVNCSALNAEELRRENGLEVIDFPPADLYAWPGTLSGFWQYTVSVQMNLVQFFLFLYPSR